jgi:hypothetical protein
MTPFIIEIEDINLIWQDVTKYVHSFDDGTGSAAQIIPTVSLRFLADAVGNLQDLIDPELNQERPRLRITEDDLTTYYILRDLSGDVQRALDNPSPSGFAAVALVNDWPALTHTWNEDTQASVIASQVCVRKPADMSGPSVGVIWSATLNPIIPGGRYSVQRKARKEILKEIAEACGAKLRVSNDGLSFEIYDRPARDLTGTVQGVFNNPLTLGYKTDKIDKPANAVRVKGEEVATTNAKLPVIEVAITPAALDADAVSTANAFATVYDASGRAVRHKEITDDPIDASSYTDIPVSGCWGGAGADNTPLVWLNTGTQQAPVKGNKVIPTSFTASEIIVPDNGNQLFIVSYIQATQVSWGLSDYVDKIDGEEQLTTGALTISSTNNIGRVRGVYRKSDVNRTGTNFFNGGSATSNTTAITLGISPGATGTEMIIDYDEYNGIPLSASISPSSSLCNETGIATTVIGAGNVVGLAVVTASALGQSGDGYLSMLGAAINSLKLTASPSTMQSAEPKSINESVVGEGVQVSNITENGYDFSVLDMAKKVLSVDQITLDLYGVVVPLKWTNDEDSGTYRIYLKKIYLTGLEAAVNYQTAAVIDPDAQVSTITAKALQADGSAATDGTPVAFTIIGKSGGATLSSDKAFTVDGEASVQLSAGNIAEFTIQAICGPLIAKVSMEVKDNPDGQEDGEADGQSSYFAYPGKEISETSDLGTYSYNAVTGHVSGQVLLKDCDGPMSQVGWSMSGPNSDSGSTNAEGIMSFNNMAPGTYGVTVNGVTRELTLPPEGG